jgi:hypothetical protein
MLVRRRKKKRTITNATPAPLLHKMSISKKLVLTGICVHPRIRASLLLQPQLSREISRAAQYLPEKQALRMKLPKERRLEMRFAQETIANHIPIHMITRAKCSPISTLRRAAAPLRLTRNINSSRRT